MKFRTLPLLLAVLTIALCASALRADDDASKTAPKFRKKKKKAATQVAEKKPDAKDEQIKLLRQQVEALTGSQQALLNRLQDLETRVTTDSKQENADIAVVKSVVDKEVEKQQAAVATAERKWGPSGKPAITPYGFFRMDYHEDSSRLNDVTNPFFVQPAPAKGVKQNANEGEITPRLTRVGLDAAGSVADWMWGHPKVGGKLETDFVNGGTDSREAIRIRLAYASLDWKEISVMAGQYWDLIAPLNPSVNPFTLLWNAGNLGDRRPQFRVTWEPDRDKTDHKHGQWSFALAALETGAVDAKDLDGNGQQDGVASAQPMLQGRVGWTAQKPADPRSDPFSIGFWFMDAHETLATPIVGHTGFNPECLGLDLVIPIAKRLDLRGEAWNGRDLSDVRGGIAQGVSTTTGQEVGAHGGWAELTLNPRGRYWASVGISDDHTRRQDLAGANDRLDNRVFYQTNHFRVGGGLELWLDISNWRTEFTDALTQSSTRVEAAVQQNF